MSSLPTGMFCPGNSILHRINPLIKLLGFIVFIAAVISARSLGSFLSLIIFTVVIIILSRVHPALVCSPVRKLFLFLVLILCMNTCFYEYGEPLFEWWIFRPSREGFVQGIRISARLVILVVAGTVLTAVTSPMEITAGLRYLFYPFSLIGIPMEVPVLLISMAIQFIPVLSAEAGIIWKAQAARGGNPGGGRIRERIRGVLPMLIPVFLGAFRRADELALAMEARGYRGGGRKIKLKKLPVHGRDLFALAVPLGILGLQIWLF